MRAPAATRPALCLAAAMAMALVSSGLLAAAAPSKAKVHGIALSGRVTKIDHGAKKMTVRDASGRDVPLSWTNATKISGGELKAGEMVTVRYLDKDKTHFATTILVGAQGSEVAAKGPPPSPAPTAPASPAAPLR